MKDERRLKGLVKSPRLTVIKGVKDYMTNSPAHALTLSQDKTPSPVTRCRRGTG